MHLNVRAAAGILGVSEKTVYRWLRQGHLPGHAVGDQLRFNRTELLEWATARGIAVTSGILDDAAAPAGGVTLSEALAAGGVYEDVAGADKNEVLQAIVERVTLPPGLERDELLRVLLARESMGSTGVGNGIAIPHVRHPIVLHVAKAFVALCYLRAPIPFQALDGKPVHTVFVIVSSSVKGHLDLLSRLALALKHAGFAEAVRRRASAEEILRECRRAETDALAAASLTKE